ncbi:heme exporter protein CcmB [Gaopeijia maritima]|uniref:heme exporter protein CcmB n=1 Tax=Gaopeijia maritima TaxID=3119007 RepID=UPI0032560514
MSAWGRGVLAVARKDLVQEFRTFQRLATMGAFTVLVGVLFSFSFDPAAVRAQDVAGGLIWMTLVFAGVMGVGRTFALEAEDAAFQGVLLSPVPRDAIYLGKVIANVVIVSITVLLIVLAFGLFFQLDYGAHPIALALTLFSGVVGFVALATLFGAVSAGTRLGESLLPVLLFPLVVPMVVYGAGATHRLLLGRPLVEVEGNIRILGAFAIGAVAVGAVLFRHVVED